MKMEMVLVVALWALVIGAAFWCFLKGGRPGGGCGGCRGCGSDGGGCNTAGGEGDDELRAEVLDIKDTGPDQDSGSETRLAVGRVWVGDFVHATFHAHWTPGRSKHPAVFDLVLGDHEDGAGPEQRIGVSVAYRNEDGQGEFRLIDATGRPFATPATLGKALRGTEVAGTPLAREVFDIAACIVRSHPMFAEIVTEE